MNERTGVGIEKFCRREFLKESWNFPLLQKELHDVQPAKGRSKKMMKG